MVLVGRLLRSHIVHSPLIVPLRHVCIDILDELLDARQVVCGELFDVVVAGTVYVVRRILVTGCPVQLLGMVEWHNLVAFAMDDVNWTLYVGHAINIWELVEGQRPPQVEHDTKSGHQPRV